MHAGTKMADFMKFRRTEWMFMDLTVLANFKSNLSKKNQLGGIDDFDQF